MVENQCFLFSSAALLPLRLRSISCVHSPVELKLALSLQDESFSWIFVTYAYTHSDVVPSRERMVLTAAEIVINLFLHAEKKSMRCFAQ